MGDDLGELLGVGLYVIAYCLYEVLYNATTTRARSLPEPHHYPQAPLYKQALVHLTPCTRSFGDLRADRFSITPAPLRAHETPPNCMNCGAPYELDVCSFCLTRSPVLAGDGLIDVTCIEDAVPKYVVARPARPRPIPSMPRSSRS